MKGHHDICIFKAGDRYRVRPAAWTSDAKKKNNGDPPEVTFRNLTDAEVLLVFPSGMLDAAQISPVAIAPARTAKGSHRVDTATVKLRGKDTGDVPGVYAYSVVVITDTGAEQAVGESEPVVIIDPPPD